MMRRILAAIAILTPLAGCMVQPLVCQRQVTGTAYAVAASCRPASAYNVIPPHGPGYAPAHPPYEAYQAPRRHEWVTDTPHWQPGDE